MKFVADLHLHSKFSRAVSAQMIFSQMHQYAKYKGISVLATGDFTHPFWFEKIQNELVDVGNGLFRLKSESEKGKVKSDKSETYFLLSCEISSIYTQGGKGRRIHNLFFFPSLKSVSKFNNELINRRANLRSDGRPIVGISSRDLAQIALECDEKALIIPAHVWTPWFSVFGSFSGFDSIEECFGDLEKHIYGVETGLSSDPAMNWQISDLQNRAVLSFSDAHSLPKMGREATVFEAKEISYSAIYDAIVGKKNSKIAFTIEFYPEEGKYHFTGHRDCNYSQGAESKSNKICPVCKRPLTVGVVDRVEALKGINSKVKSEVINDVRWNFRKDSKSPPYISLVPLIEILAESISETKLGVSTKKVTDAYLGLVSTFGSEFNVLLKAKIADIAKIMPDRVAEAIGKVRLGNIEIEAGYDGKFGLVKIFKENVNNVEELGEKMQNSKDISQLNLL